MLKTLDDVSDDVKKNGNELQTKVSKETREHALAVRPRLKLLEMYAKNINGQSYLELVNEYNAASDALVGLGSDLDGLNGKLMQISNDFQQALLLAIRQVCDDFVQKTNQLHAAIRENAVQREIGLSRIAVVAEALRTYEGRADAEIEQLKSQIELQRCEIERLKRKRTQNAEPIGNKPNPDYKELMIFQYGRNKAYSMLREEGYDV